MKVVQIVAMLMAICTFAAGADTIAEVTHKVFFDVTIHDYGLAGRIVFGLFGNVVPKTVKNFAKIAAGDDPNFISTNGMPGSTDTPIWYWNSNFYRIIPGFIAQGGDILRGDEGPTMTKSVHRGESSLRREILGIDFNVFLEDENFDLKHSKRYLLSMANKGPNTNSSHFFITFAPLPMLDGKNVVFGEVIEGHRVVDIMEKFGSGSGLTREFIYITNCGILE